MAREIAPATATISFGGLPSFPSEAHAAIESIMGELDSLPDKPKSPDKPTPSPTNIDQTSPKEEAGKHYKSLFEGLNGGKNYQQCVDTYVGHYHGGRLRKPLGQDWNDMVDEFVELKPMKAIKGGDGSLPVMDKVRVNKSWKSRLEYLTRTPDQAMTKARRRKAQRSKKRKRESCSVHTAWMMNNLKVDDIWKMQTSEFCPKVGKRVLMLQDYSVTRIDTDARTAGIMALFFATRRLPLMYIFHPQISILWTRLLLWDSTWWLKFHGMSFYSAKQSRPRHGAIALTEPLVHNPNPNTPAAAALI